MGLPYPMEREFRMNCFSGSIIVSCLIACVACGAPASGTDGDSASFDYAVHYTITPDPDTGSVDIEMRVRQARRQLREVQFELDPKRYSSLAADGKLSTNGSEVSWLPAERGGQLSFRVSPSHKRGSGGYDALLDNHWGIFRAEDVIPRARTRTLKGAVGKTTMSFELPAGWSAVTEYSSLSDRIEVSNDARRFSQPTGWIAIGVLGVRRETIAGVRVTVAAPEGEKVRRMDMLALLNWTLPELTAIRSAPVSRLTVVSAGDPMWRGGLSAPRSLFIHADRPLISENATSTLVHELVHVVLGIRAEEGYDWIAEGLAEYYSLEMLHRAGAITSRRYARALEDQADWAEDATMLCGVDSKGATTALAVITFRRLDEELRRATQGKFSLDKVVDQMSEGGLKVSLAALSEIVDSMLERPSKALHIDRLPGCSVERQRQEPH